MVGKKSIGCGRKNLSGIDLSVFVYADFNPGSSFPLMLPKQGAGLPALVCAGTGACSRIRAFCMRCLLPFSLL